MEPGYRPVYEASSSNSKLRAPTVVSKVMDRAVDASFTRALPKVELHAHLTGSITPETLHSLWLTLSPSVQSRFDDPLIALSRDRSWDVSTFFPLFSSYIYSLVSTRESIIFTTNSVLSEFHADGVRYLELRTTPRSSSAVTKEEYVEMILSCIAAFPQWSEMSIYLILSIDRRSTPSQAMEVVDLALKFQDKGVVGVDLCGDPSKGDVSTFREAFTRAKTEGLKLTLHFAETHASSSKEELQVLMGFQPDRLGHVIQVTEDVKNEIRRRKIALELCVSCNVQAKLTKGGVGGHHFGMWKGGECPVILCTDDVGVFGSKLSNEYLLVAQHYGLSRRELYDLSYGSIDAIFRGDDDRQRLRAAWRRFEESDRMRRVGWTTYC